MPDYSKGKVYKVVNSVNDVIYIGSTCQPLSARMTGHRWKARSEQTQAMYCAMRELGIEKFRIILVEEFPCISKSQLEAKEFALMRDAKFSGIQLYNHMLDGRHSEATRAKMSQSISKRGCVSYHSTRGNWSFQWRENGKTISKTFSIKKYGTAARGLALYWQEEIYPIEREDDSELIREIRARIEA